MSLANYFFTQPLEPPLRCALDLPAGDLEVKPVVSLLDLPEHVGADLEVDPLTSLLDLPEQTGGGSDCVSS